MPFFNPSIKTLDLGTFMISKPSLKFNSLPVLAGLVTALSLMTACDYNVEQPCSDRQAVYNESVASVFNAHCAGCHGGSNPTAGQSLDDFESTSNATLSGDVLYRIKLPTNDPLAMPPNGSFRECDVTLLENWAANGAPLE